MSLWIKTWHDVHNGTLGQTPMAILPWLPDCTCSGEIPQPSMWSQGLPGSSAAVNSPLRLSSVLRRWKFLYHWHMLDHFVPENNRMISFLHIEQTEASRAWVIYLKVTWVQWVGNCSKRNSFQLILRTFNVLPNMSVQPHGSLFFCAMTQVLRKLG